MVRGHLTIGRLIAAGALLSSLVGCATAEIVNPAWRTVPDGEAMGDAYPGFASHIGVEGRVAVICTAGIDGRLSDCKVDKIRPLGLGFDDAALSLTDRFVAEPQTRNGEPRPSRVAFRVTFALPPVNPVTAWDGAEPSAEHLALARDVAPRFVPGLRQGRNAVNLDGLDADRVEAVQAMLDDIEREFRPEAVEAVAWAMARTTTPETLRMLSVGNRRPPRPNMTDEQLERAGDKIEAVGLRANARLNALYCARYDCGDDR